MFRRAWTVCLSGLLTIGLVGSASTAEAARKKTPKKPVVKATKFIPDARKVELFDGMKSGEVEAKVVAYDPFTAKVLIENKTDAPLNIQFPKAVVAAPVLPQFGGGMGGMGGGGMGGMGGGMGGMGGGMGGGGGQMMGGGMGGMGGGMGGMGGGMGGMGGGMGGGGMGGMFSVPPEKIVSLSLNTVCLEHGKDDPNVGMRYQLYPVSAVSKDPMFTEFLAIVGSGKVDRQSAQAAAWYLANNLSWQQLAMKDQGVEGSAPYFSAEELAAAQQLLALASRQVDLGGDNSDAEESEPEAAPQETAPRSPRISQIKN
ncbi:MAG: hypothetical protein U0872_05830 [Planctomycetaceae bacterium]